MGAGALRGQAGRKERAGSWGQADGAHTNVIRTDSRRGMSFGSCSNRWRSPSPGYCETDLTDSLVTVAPSAKRLGGGKHGVPSGEGGTREGGEEGLARSTECFVN